MSILSCSLTAMNGFTYMMLYFVCVADSCTDVKVDVEQSLMSGTMELIDCRAITIRVNPVKPLPTLSAERCHDLQLFFYEPTNMDSIYTMQCSNIRIYFQPPHTVINDVFSPEDDAQYVTRCSEGYLDTVPVVREEGGYATVGEEIWTAKEKAEQIQEFMEVYLPQLIAARARGAQEDSVTDAAAIGGGGKPLSSTTKAEDEKKEFFDNEEELCKKMDLVAEWLRNSKHAITFTGAGISTSCGIPDYRSGMDTVLKTGPGVWELVANETKRPEGASVTPIINALPSLAHMAIVQLHREEKVLYTVSQNIDGLHRRSGLHRAQLAELHGNTNMETCKKCGRQYLRDFETRMSKQAFDHTTSRHCADTSCNGTLHDSIINFGEPLPEAEIKSAFKAGDEADVCIVLGSSLRVSPANLVPMKVYRRGQKVVICNLQKIPDYTPNNNTIQVFAKCDDFMEGVCKRLGVQIPPFVLHRRAEVLTEALVGDGEQGVKVTVTGLDVDEDLPYSFIKAIATRYEEKAIEVSQEPFSITLPTGCPTDNLPPVRVQCQGHYGEPTILLECPPVGGKVVYRMAYEVLARENWVVTKEDQEESQSTEITH